MSGESATISTHVLDATAGRPAAGIRVVLQARDESGAGGHDAGGHDAGGTRDGGDRLPGDGEWQIAADGTTGPDGRLRFPAAAPPGQYRLTFGTGSYFASRGLESFYPEVTVTFTVTAGHYHVPLLLSPFAFSTYRGS